MALDSTPVEVRISDLEPMGRFIEAVGRSTKTLQMYQDDMPPAAGQAVDDLQAAMIQLVKIGIVTEVMGD